MHSPFVEFISFLFTCAAFGAGGFSFAKKFTQPQSCIMFLLIVLGTFFCFFIGSEVTLITVIGFPIYLKTALLAFGLGLLVGLIVSLKKYKSSENIVV
ncbi:MAG: hypothetical protein R6W90_10405 [Ignavibacteriaceae bacterium]